MRKVLLAIYFVLDIVLPYSALIYSSSTGQFPGWVGGLSLFFLILVVAVYGYVLIQSFPKTTVAMWKAIGQQIFAITLTWLAFWGSWRVGVQQWSVAVVGALLLALGLALLVSWRLEQDVVARFVMVGFGLPLSVVGLGWLWVLRPTITPLSVLTWILWLASWLEHCKHRFDFVYNYFKHYYLDHKVR